MAKVDYKKQFKSLYLPKKQPEIMAVPPLRFAMLDGHGDPNGEAFAEVVAALYSFSYAVKMSYKSKAVPDGYYDYTVFPLEGVWDLAARFITEVKKKKPNDFLDQIWLEDYDEGTCCQMLHLGSYDDEPASFAQMEAFCSEHGYRRSDKTHREIYLSDPRRTETAKLKTVLRFKVKAD